MAPSASSSKPKPKHTRTVSSATARGSQQLPKTEITINVYDLLPPGRLSSLLWTVGGSLLHSGVVIKDREYAFGGHSQRGVTGVYWTKPGYVPPGGTFRSGILQGFTFRTAAEIDELVRDVSAEFLGVRYNLLTCNCNHFTSVLCERLTGKAAPSWLNRAASIGVALPCVVPREWIAPPDVETADGELVEDEAREPEEESGSEREDAGMMASDQRRRDREERGRKKPGEEREDEASDGEQEAHSLAGGRRIVSTEGTPPPRMVAIKDSSGRDLPAAERAPVPRKP